MRLIGLQSSSASQGRKIARDFLLKLQCQVGVNKEPYSFELVKQIFAETNGDLDMFFRRSQV